MAPSLKLGLQMPPPIEKVEIDIPVEFFADSPAIGTTAGRKSFAPHDLESGKDILDAPIKLLANMFRDRSSHDG